MNLMTLVTACALGVDPRVMHALICQQSGGEPWSLSVPQESNRQVYPTTQDAFREARIMRPDGGRIRVGLTGLSTDPRSATAPVFTPCTASAARDNDRERGWPSALFPLKAPTPDRASADVPNRDRSAEEPCSLGPAAASPTMIDSTSRQPVCAEIDREEAVMVRLGMLRRLSNIVAGLKVEPGRGDDPTDRWQDKSREVRRGRSAQERREISHLPRGAYSQRSLPLPATRWNVETSCTSRAGHS
jgi:hypothetical protein